MALALAWFLFGLGILHVLVGTIKFKAQLIEAFKSGFIGKFSVPESRRTAFWFLVVGPLLMLVGNIGIHAAEVGDLKLFKITGFYLLFISVFGVLAIPKSPFLGLLIASPLIIACGYGLF